MLASVAILAFQEVGAKTRLESPPGLADLSLRPKTQGFPAAALKLLSADLQKPRPARTTACGIQGTTTATTTWYV